MGRLQELLQAVANLSNAIELRSRTELLKKEMCRSALDFGQSSAGDDGSIEDILAELRRCEAEESIGPSLSERVAQLQRLSMAVASDSDVAWTAWARMQHFEHIV